uniref:SufB protein n=1 Tax=Spumella sp. NIES-1846 TaxID=2490549 RepID=A0A455RG00_9STRA|nr:sufB protein [Spumella sp. NIES-1846]
MVLKTKYYLKKKEYIFYLNVYKLKKNSINNYFSLGINKIILTFLSLKKKESQFFYFFRNISFNFWQKKKTPLWTCLQIKSINYNKILFYNKSSLMNFYLLTPKLLKIFQKLNIFKINLNLNLNLAVDIVFDSLSILTLYQQKLAKYGIIFSSISEALILDKFILQHYLGKCIHFIDNYYTTLNSAVFSDGSFCYIPQKIICPLDLSTYFQINNKKLGQFERTLIICEKYSKVNYIEGCTAKKHINTQLHAAVVELFSLHNSNINYSTIQNWYKGTKYKKGGVYNFVTKRGIALGILSKIIWLQIELGSSITWKYPSSILLGKNSYSEFYSLTITKYFQQTDTGTKMIHLGAFSKSKILSKTILFNDSKNIFRSLIKIGNKAHFSKSYSQCDSFLFQKKTLSLTYPLINISNSTSILEHEAKISTLTEIEFFYLLQRGINLNTIFLLILFNFCKDIILKLPLELMSEITFLLKKTFKKNYIYD